MEHCSLHLVAGAVEAIDQPKLHVGSTKRAEPDATHVHGCVHVLQLLIIGPATAGSAGPGPQPLSCVWQVH